MIGCVANAIARAVPVAWTGNEVRYPGPHELAGRMDGVQASAKLLGEVFADAKTKCPPELAELLQQVVDETLRLLQLKWTLYATLLEMTDAERTAYMTENDMFVKSMEDR